MAASLSFYLYIVKMNLGPKAGGVKRNLYSVKIERFQAKWKPVRVKKTRQIKNLEPRFDSIEAEKALDPNPSFRGARECEPGTSP
jgi:hypothetical protein